MSIKIITDSACDLSKDIINEYDIEVIPLLVYLDDKEYLDGETIDPIEVFNEMRSGKTTKTAQVPIDKFEKIFKKHAESNENCIYIAFSSGLSGTYQTSMIVKNQILEDYPDFDLDIIDTKCASGGFGLVVYKAAMMAKQGKTKEEILDAIDFYKNKMEHIFTVDDLEYLYRGGRVSKASKIAAGVLNIKPILNVEDGKLIPLEKLRGRNKAIKRMTDIMEERGCDLKNQTIGINHGDDLDSAMKLKSMIEERFGCDEFLINTIGSAVGAHSGPGTLALFFLNEKYSY